MEQATKKLFKSMITQGLDPSSLLKSIPQSSAAPSGTDASLSSGTMSTYQEPEEDGSSSEEELTPPPSHYSSNISSAHTPNEATHGNPEATDSESEEENDSDGLSGDEYENKSSHGPIASISDSQDEEEDITPGHAKTTDSGAVDATDVSSGDNDTPARKKKRQELYCEFTWAELSHSIDLILPIPKPDGTGGRDYSIKEMIGLGSNHQDDADTYKDILCSVHSHCGKNLDLSLPMRKKVKAKIVLVELKVKSSKANRALDNRHAAPSVVSDAPIAKAAPPVVSDVPIAKNTFSSKSKVRPRPNFPAVETREPDVRHDLETLDIGTASQTAKSKKKKSIAVAASMASKKGVSGIKRKKPVEDDDGPGPSKRYKTLESIPVPAKGKEKTAKITKAAKGAPSKISSSTAAGSSGVRKTKRQPVPSARAHGDHP
ncbi:hypothetical protein JB92DRAFT_3123424 [Gautieria morchelliformis]|nr:hypothetical protein JB92DRAFT_3123424 [Gautieria morchelliformis]